MMRLLRRMACLPWCRVLLALSCASGAAAQESHYRLYEQREGLGSGEIIALAQDRDGFLWLGTNAGIVRFDGSRFVPWASQRKLGDIPELCVDAATDQLVMRDDVGAVLARDGGDIVPLSGPDGVAFHGIAAIACARGGGLWVIGEGRLWRRDAALRWHEVDRSGIGEGVPHRLSASADGMLLLTDRGAWLLRDGAPPRHLLDAADLWLGCDDGHGGYWFASHLRSGLWHVGADRTVAMTRPYARSIDLLRRGETIWLALDRYLLAFEPDGRVRSFETARGFPSGGPLLVDAEGSLWTGTFVGLVQFPEPDTWQWSERQGLPSQHALDVLQTDDGVLIDTWGGAVLFGGDPPAAQAAAAQAHRGVLCRAQDGALWGADAQGLWSWHAGALRRVDAGLATPTTLSACAEDAAHGLWFAVSDELLHWNAGSDHATAVPVRGLPHGQILDLLWIDGSGAFWSAAGENLCRLVSAEDGAAFDAQGCVRAGVGEAVFDVEEIAPGRFWLGTHRGLWRFDGRRADWLGSAAGFANRSVKRLSPSPRGGYWITDLNTPLRVAPCETCAQGWTLLERPGGWQGLPGNSALGALELPNGDLWLAGNRGAWRIPAHARAAPGTAPAVRLVGVAAGRRVADPGARFELHPDERQLALEFAALSYRDRGLLRFRSRLDTAKWSAPSAQSSLQFVDLPGGGHRVEMQASLDGTRWSDAAAVEFKVIPPWYRRGWAHALLVLLAVALASALYRWRVAMLLRIERERSHIAMDLHDEMGANLGSIGMLAEVAARGDLGSDERRRLAAEIAGIADFLGAGLRSLVWSMRSDRAGMAELAAQIVDHARRLFPAEPPRLCIDLPSRYPPAPVRADVRRHVLLVALEAMHNAARHAQAREVRIVLAADGNAWTLHVEDDGRGFDAGEGGGGTGLDSMRRRAAAIGARLDVTARPGQGTRVTLRFDPLHPRASHDHALARRRAPPDSGAA